MNNLRYRRMMLSAARTCGSWPLRRELFMLALTPRPKGLHHPVKGV